MDLQEKCLICGKRSFVKILSAKALPRVLGVSPRQVAVPLAVQTAPALCEECGMAVKAKVFADWAGPLAFTFSEVSAFVGRPWNALPQFEPDGMAALAGAFKAAVVGNRDDLATARRVLHRWFRTDGDLTCLACGDRHFGVRIMQPAAVRRLLKVRPSQELPLNVLSAFAFCATCESQVREIKLFNDWDGLISWDVLHAAKIWDIGRIPRPLEGVAHEGVNLIQALLVWTEAPNPSDISKDAWDEAEAARAEISKSLPASAVFEDRFVAGDPRLAVQLPREQASEKARQKMAAQIAKPAAPPRPVVVKAAADRNDPNYGASKAKPKPLKPEKKGNKGQEQQATERKPRRPKAA